MLASKRSLLSPYLVYRCSSVIAFVVNHQSVNPNMDGVKYGSDYITCFDPDIFLKTYYTEVKGIPSVGDMRINQMMWFHEAFAAKNIRGRRLLDLGTGPTIHTIISASPYADNIYLSDYAPQNREALKMWLNGTLQHSFHSFFKYAVEAEGNGISPSVREMQVREKISGICHVDLLQEYPLTPSIFPRFDIITTALCIEAVAENHAEYEKMARRVTDMLQDGGHLVLFGVLGAKFYTVGQHLFRALEIDREKVQETWKTCGFDIVDWKQSSRMIPGGKASADFKGYYLMVAKKVKIQN